MTSKAAKNEKPKAAKTAKKAPAKKAAKAAKAAPKAEAKAPTKAPTKAESKASAAEAAVVEVQDFIAEHDYATSAVSRQESIDFHRDIAQYCTERANEIQEELDSEEPDEDTDGGEPDTDDLDVNDD